MQNLRKIYKKVFICIVSLVATVSFSNTSYASSNLDQDDEHKVGNSASVMNIMNVNIKKLHADIKDIRKDIRNNFKEETEKNSALQKLLGELQNSLASLTRRVNNIVTDGLTFNEPDFELSVSGELPDDTTFKANTITEIDLDEV